jgi:hypothetical protein
VIEMDNKTMYAIVAVVIVVIVVAAVGAYVYLYSGGGGGGGGGTTEDTYVPGNATSLQFSVDVTPASGEASTTTYYAKNLGGTEAMVRVEIVVPDYGTLVYIVNGADQMAWNNGTGTWTDVSSDFTNQWDDWVPTFQSYQDSLVSWASGDYTYTADNGDSVRIYDIIVNPTLADSLFAAPA